jgi:hypothetical protein
MAHGTNSVNYVTSPQAFNTQSGILAGNARLVKTGVTTAVIPNGISGQITTTITTVAHNLGYAPLAQAYLNNANISGSVQHVNLALPFIISAGDNTGGTGGAPDYIGIISFMQYATDATNFYVVTYSSGSMTATSINVTYYLYQQQAVQT